MLETKDLNMILLTLWVLIFAKIKEDRVILIPLSIFLDRGISVLEAVSEYLKDSKGFSYHDMAVLLNRNDRTVWTCYNRAKKKRDKKWT